jgi:hypothetical protein
MILQGVLLCPALFECALEIPNKIQKYIRIAGIHDEILTLDSLNANRKDEQPYGNVGYYIFKINVTP